MSFEDSGKEAVGSYIGWIILAAISPIFPYHLGAFIPILSILSSVSEIGNSSGAAIFGAFVTMLLAFVFRDQVTSVLAFLAIIVGIIALIGRAMHA